MTSGLSVLSKLGISLALTIASLSISSKSHAQCFLSNLSIAQFNNSDHSGGDYRSIDLTSYSGVFPRSSACEYNCMQDSACAAWTYVASNRTCYLKNQIGALVAASGMTTGRMFESNTNYDGSDYMEVPNSTTPSMCHTACLGDYFRCRAWTWVQSNNTCYLKNSIPSNKTTVQGMVSAMYDFSCIS